MRADGVRVDVRPPLSGVWSGGRRHADAAIASSLTAVGSRVVGGGTGPTGRRRAGGRCSRRTAAADPAREGTRRPRGPPRGGEARRLCRWGSPFWGATRESVAVWPRVRRACVWGGAAAPPWGGTPLAPPRAGTKADFSSACDGHSRPFLVDAPPTPPAVRARPPSHGARGWRRRASRHARPVARRPPPTRRRGRRGRRRRPLRARAGPRLLPHTPVRRECRWRGGADDRPCPKGGTRKRRGGRPPPHTQGRNPWRWLACPITLDRHRIRASNAACNVRPSRTPQSCWPPLLDPACLGPDPCARPVEGPPPCPRRVRPTERVLCHRLACLPPSGYRYRLLFPSLVPSLSPPPLPSPCPQPQPPQP